MSWPLNSADLNPAENIWEIIKSKFHGKQKSYTKLVTVETKKKQL